MGRFNWSVDEVTPCDDYTMEIVFHDGKRGVFDMKPLIDKPIYRKLKSRSYFVTAHVEGGTVVWDDDVDIAPEILYESCFGQEG